MLHPHKTPKIKITPCKNMCLSTDNIDNEAGNWLHLKLNKCHVKRVILELLIEVGLWQALMLEVVEVLSDLETKLTFHWRMHQPRTQS